MKVFVNGDPHHVDGTHISYDDVVQMYRPGFKAPPGFVWTVCYWARRDGWHKDGCLAPGQQVELIEGMRISIAHTGNA